jgi:hypothetical protein
MYFFLTQETGHFQEFEILLQNWMVLVELQIGSNPTLNGVFPRPEIFKNIGRVLSDEVTVLSQIFLREMSVKEYHQDFEKMKKQTNVKEADRNLKLDAAKHKYNTLMTENRLFRLEQLRLLQIKRWECFKISSIDLSKMYMQIANQNASDSLVSMGNSNSSQIEGGLSDSKDSYIAPLNPSPRPPPPYSDGARKFSRATAGKRLSAGSVGLVGLHRFSNSDSVPSISVHPSQDGMNILPNLPLEPSLLDPSRAVQGRQLIEAHSSPFLKMSTSRPKELHYRRSIDINPSKPPPPIPRMQTSKASRLL